MRTSLLASLALTATLTSAFAPSIADACGPYGGGPRLPSVFAVDVHHASRESGESQGFRTFVLFGSAAPTEKVTWTRLAPMTFDYTRIADAPDTTHATTVTLIGPGGARVVSSKDRTFIADSFRARNEQTAMEVKTGTDAQFSIAVLGSQPDAKWIDVKDFTPRASATAWLREQGVEPTTVYASRVEGTYIQIFSTYQKDQSSATSVIRLGNQSLGQATGNAIGAIDLGGKRYVLFEEQGLITPVAV